MSTYEEVVGKCEDAVKKLFERLNGSSRELTETLIKSLQNEHRTLVQSFYRMVYKVIQDYVNEDKKFKTYVDGRNQDSYEWAKQVAKIKGYFPLI